MISNKHSVLERVASAIDSYEGRREADVRYCKDQVEIALTALRALGLQLVVLEAVEDEHLKMLDFAKKTLESAIRIIDQKESE